MKSRTDRPRKGPLSRSEIEALFERGYSLGTRRYLALQWALDPENQAEDLPKLLVDDELVAERVGDLTEKARQVVAEVVAAGGRLRGENLRRDLVLRGFPEAGDVIEHLVVRGILIPVPNPGEADLDLESLLEREKVMQRDLAVPVPVIDLIGGDSGVAAARKEFTGDVSEMRRGDVNGLELNLLHLSSMLQHEGLRLNKSGAPNRRSLGRFARGVSMPGQLSEAGDDLDLNDAEQMDYLVLLLALAIELELIAVDEEEETIRGNRHGIRAYFGSDEKERNRALETALRSLRHFSELDSLELSASREETEDHLSQSEATGEPLIGARGFVFSVLRRSGVEGWTTLSNIFTLCEQIDPDYLPSALGNIEARPDDFVDGLVGRLLARAGLVDVGVSEEGLTVVRFHERARRILGMEAPDPEEPQVDGCMVVQPNLEIMVFLDNAPLEALYRVYEIGARKKLADRVATFNLTAETVQRGYAAGATADQVTALLDDYSHAPVPDSIEFQLNDWERVHRRLTLYADAILVRHEDPDALDLIIGQLEHDNRGEVDVVRLGPGAAVLGSPDPEGLDRVVERHDALQIDYLGEVPASLWFVDPLVVMLDPIECDIVTLFELDRIAIEDEESPAGSRFYELDIGLIEKRWPEDTLRRVVAFLDPRTEGGLPAAQYLKLRSLLADVPSAEVRSGRTILVLETEDVGDIFMRVEEAQDWLEERLGPRAFQIADGHEEAARALLDELGIKLV